MDLQQRLGAFQARELIDEHIVRIVLNVRCHLQQDWRVDVETEQVKMMLVHIASADSTWILCFTVVCRFFGGNSKCGGFSASFADSSKNIGMPSVCHSRRRTNLFSRQCVCLSAGSATGAGFCGQNGLRK